MLASRTSLLLAAVVSVLPALAAGKALVVNNSGSPTCADATTYAANDAVHPWCTVGRAAWGSTDPNAPVPAQAAQAGDTVAIAAGTYTTIAPRTACASGARWAVALNPANSGTSSAPITFLGLGTVNIYLGAGYVGPTIGADGRDYIVWDNVRIDEQTAPGVSCGDTGPVVLHATTGSKILNSTIRGTYRAWGDNYNGIRTEAVNAATIAHNTISEVTGDFGHNDAAIMMYDTANSTFEHNYIHDSAVAVYVKGDHSGDGWPQENNTFRFNWLENLSNKAIFCYTAAGTSIYQNIIKDSPYGVRQFGAAVNANIVIVNNTFISTGAYASAAGYSVYGDAGALTNLRFFNNIVAGPYGEAVNLGDVTVIGGQTAEHNVYYGFSTFGSLNGAQLSFSTWQATHGQDEATPTGITNDPLFVSPTYPSGYQLQAGSPARSIGVDLLDLNGNASTTDLIPAGAYITGSEVIGPGSGAPHQTDGGVPTTDGGAADAPAADGALGDGAAGDGTAGDGSLVAADGGSPDTPGRDGPAGDGNTADGPTADGNAADGNTAREGSSGCGCAASGRGGGSLLAAALILVGARGPRRRRR